MFRQYQLRTTSGSTGRSPSARPTSSGTSSRASVPASSRHLSSTGPYGSADSSALAGFGLEPPPSSQPRRRVSSEMLSEVEEPISAGVRRRRNSEDHDNSHSAQLSPRRMKRLKTYAKDLCDELEIPEKKLFDFVESGNVYYMLVNMKASLLKYESTNQANESKLILETLTSKDFEIALHNRLLACLLSPNLTAYVTDTQRHVMDFIFEHQDVFKIPAGLFDDSELKSTLRATVSRLLATIRSHLKTQLTLSISKKTCIIDVTKSLARLSSGMEVDAAHWNRLAFLVSGFARNSTKY
ncbi:hypothetical protein HD554DRAFT_713099 [Boletus coccyginus]|nr:hypothetical protein HD554DRAFT_713099 [Boletus coccyginus]